MRRYKKVWAKAKTKNTLHILYSIFVCETSHPLAESKNAASREIWAILYTKITFLRADWAALASARCPRQSEAAHGAAGQGSAQARARSSPKSSTLRAFPPHPRLRVSGAMRCYVRFIPVFWSANLLHVYVLAFKCRLQLRLPAYTDGNQEAEKQHGAQRARTWSHGPWAPAARPPRRASSSACGRLLLQHLRPSPPLRTQRAAGEPSGYRRLAPSRPAC